MTETLTQSEAVLEVISPDGARKYVRIAQTPFLIGRGSETGNHLQLTDRRISRTCGAIVIEANRYYIEDRGQRRGLFVNGDKVESRALNDGDLEIRVGVPLLRQMPKLSQTVDLARVDALPLVSDVHAAPHGLPQRPIAFARDR